METQETVQEKTKSLHKLGNIFFAQLYIIFFSSHLLKLTSYVVIKPYCAQI